MAVHGAMTASISNLTAGTYLVTVSDGNGCEEVLDFVVDFNVATSDLEALSRLSLQPNPTNQLSNLILEFEHSVDVEIQLHNMLGQNLLTIRQDAVQSTNIPFDFSVFK